MLDAAALLGAMLGPVKNGDGTALEDVGTMLDAAPPLGGRLGIDPTKDGAPLGGRLGIDPTKDGAELVGAGCDGAALSAVGATLVTEPALGNRLDKDPATDGTLLVGFN